MGSEYRQQERDDAIDRFEHLAASTFGFRHEDEGEGTVLMDERTDEYLSCLHHNGVHVECRPVRKGKPDGTWRKCLDAGKVERFHGHSFEGPLVCGCPDEWIG
jgi:hypothetical protein